MRIRPGRFLAGAVRNHLERPDPVGSLKCYGQHLGRSKRVFLWQIVLICTMAFAASVWAADRPNFILLYTDDQAANMTGFEGHPLIKTPHLDQLAADGIYFSRCYVPTPQCAPSRACVLTGQYPHTHGVTTNNLPLKPGVETFTARLAENGYACAIVGKWHLTYENVAAPGYGFADYTATVGQPWSWEDCDVWVQGTKTKADKFLTDWIADRAIEFLERPHKKPFFLWVCFRAPHLPHVYPPGTEDLYPPESVDLPRSMHMSPQNQPAPLRNSPLAIGYKKMNEQKLREARSKYYAMITHVDTNIGRILEQVDILQLRNNTLVVFASDNGWALGDHQLYKKGPAFYEELIRSPLLIRYPRLTLAKSGIKIDRVVSQVDLAPTFLELADIQVPMAIQGRSLLPAIHKPDTARHRDERFLEYHEQPGYKCQVRGIVTDKYKFVDYLGSSGQLFDLKRDPEEMHNAINDTEYVAVVKVLRMRLERWRKLTKDR